MPSHELLALSFFYCTPVPGWDWKRRGEKLNSTFLSVNGAWTAAGSFRFSHDQLTRSNDCRRWCRCHRCNVHSRAHPSSSTSKRITTATATTTTTTNESDRYTFLLLSYNPGRLEQFSYFYYTTLRAAAASLCHLRRPDEWASER